MAARAKLLSITVFRRKEDNIPLGLKLRENEHRGIFIERIDSNGLLAKTLLREHDQLVRANEVSCSDLSMGLAGFIDTLESMNGRIVIVVHNLAGNPDLVECAVKRDMNHHTRQDDNLGVAFATSKDRCPVISSFTGTGLFTNSVLSVGDRCIMVNKQSCETWSGMRLRACLEQQVSTERGYISITARKPSDDDGDSSMMVSNFNRSRRGGSIHQATSPRTVQTATLPDSLAALKAGLPVHRRVATDPTVTQNPLTAGNYLQPHPPNTGQPSLLHVLKHSRSLSEAPEAARDARMNTRENTGLSEPGAQRVMGINQDQVLDHEEASAIHVEEAPSTHFEEASSTLVVQRAISTTSDDRTIPQAELVSGVTLTRKFLRRMGATTCTLILFLVVFGVVGIYFTAMYFNESPTNPRSSEPGTTNRVSGTTNGESTLEAVFERAYLNCGVANEPFQAMMDPESGEWKGFLVDMCRAIAAGVFGHASDNVNFLPVDPANMFLDLANGNVDVLVSGTTITMARDVHEPSTGKGFTFSTPYLYEGLFYAGAPDHVDCAERLSQNVTDSCPGMVLCVIEATTHEDIVNDLMPNPTKFYTVDQRDSYERLASGDCNVMAAESMASPESVVNEFGYTGPYRIGAIPFSKEPLCFVTNEGDPRWSDFVNWILQALLSAEEKSIVRANAAAMGTSSYFGSRYSKMSIDAIATVGSYGEIYNRHLAPAVPRSGANTVNSGMTGLIYSMPFGDYSQVGAWPLAGSTLQKVKDRGFLKCGVARRGFFAQHNVTENKWFGLDVDFCKAISAAIFSGRTSNIDYIEVSASDRFKLLQQEGVDLLARITTITQERDVLEPSIGEGVSYSQSYFYDGLTFGGIPPFGNCSDRLDYVSPECEQLKICVSEGTTYITKIQELFPSQFIVPVRSGEELVEGLLKEQCNAIGGGVADDVSNLRQRFDQPYEVGENRYTTEPLALVTRQDDPRWSDFCYWVVSLLFYAEEQRITSETAVKDLPLVYLFGSIYTGMFRDAVTAVGSFGSIYSRNVEEAYPRGGLNLVNQHPYGPQHYPLFWVD